jgi:hypothetical protein
MDGGVVNRFGPKAQKSNQNRKRRKKWWKYIHQGDSNPSPHSPGLTPLTVGHAHVCNYIRTQNVYKLKWYSEKNERAERSKYPFSVLGFILANPFSLCDFFLSPTVLHWRTFQTNPETGAVVAGARRRHHRAGHHKPPKKNSF